MTNENNQCPYPFICPIMQDGQPMQDPVIAADGHTYERSGIDRWLANHTTSPVARSEMVNKNLLPNHAMKSQIEQWREEQKGVTARLKKLEALLAKIHLCESRADALSALSVLSDFIAESETPIQAGQLKRIRIMLENDDELWSDTVKGALEVVEAQCQATTQTLQGKLRKVKLLYDVSSRAHAKVVANKVSKGKELEESEEKVKRLEAELKREKMTVESLKHNLEHGHKTEPYRKIEEEYEEEVENIQRVLGRKAAAEEEGEEEEEVQGGGKKRKRGSGGESGARATEQAKPDMGILFVEGWEWWSGTNFRKRDVLRGQMLIEAAADEGVAVAEACCMYHVWGERWDDGKLDGFKRFKELLAEGNGEHQAIAMFMVGLYYDYCGLCGHTTVSGTTMDEDDVMMLEWWGKAAEKGNCDAMFALGKINVQRGVDMEMVEEWFKKAAALGHAEAKACLMLESVYCHNYLHDLY